MDQHWLSIVIVILIIVIIVDGIRRMRKARRDSIKMALKPAKRKQEESEINSDQYGSEFPNGGARVSQRKIDPDRINKVRNKYDFGKDMSAWKTKVAETIAEHTGSPSKDTQAPRIEPSMDDVDPLLDDMRDYRSQDESHPAGEHAVTQENKTKTPAPSAQAPSVSEEAVSEEAELEEESLDTTGALPVSKPTRQTAEPVQTSLNLEDAVPMLMDSVDEKEERSHGEMTSGENSNKTEEDTETLVAEKPEPIVKVATHIEPVAEDKERTLVDRSANKPRYESKYTDHTQHHLQAPQEVLVIHVRAAENEFFYGSDLLELILDNGLRYGAMDIFHRHAGEDGEGPILFSMANMVKPGVFDLHTFEDFSTIGLSFFLGLPAETGSEMAAFDTMLATAKDIAERLQGELKDENRSVLTKQTIEHYRERIRDFSRRQQLEKNKS